MSKIIFTAHSLQIAADFAVKKKAATVDEDKSEDFAPSLHEQTFRFLSLMDSTSREHAQWFSVDRQPGDAKTPVSLAASSWLLKRHPHAWTSLAGPESIFEAPVIFIGFDVQEFLTVLGIECSLPGYKLTGGAAKDNMRSEALPWGLWRNAAYLDLSAILNPDGQASWSRILKRRGLEKRFANWQPHTEPDADLLLGVALSGQLNLPEQLR